MKKVILVMLCAWLLSGCAGAPVLETLGEVEHVSATQPSMKQLQMQLPQDAVVLAMSAENAVYLCEDYTAAVQIFPSGDLNASIRSISGFEKDAITLMQTDLPTHTQVDLVWTAAAEGTDAVCRAVILDDGNYHYCLTLMANAQDALRLKDAWNAVIGSFSLES